MCHKILFIFCFFNYLKCKSILSSQAIQKQALGWIWSLGPPPRFQSCSLHFLFSGDNERSCGEYYGPIVDHTSLPPTILLTRISHRPYQHTNDVENTVSNVSREENEMV